MDPQFPHLSFLSSILIEPPPLVFNLLCQVQLISTFAFLMLSCWFLVFPHMCPWCAAHIARELSVNYNIGIAILDFTYHMSNFFLDQELPIISYCPLAI